MRALPGAALLVLAALGCRPATPGGYTLLFFQRAPVAVVGDRFWAPDPDRSRLVVLDDRLRVVRGVTDPALALPVSAARLGDHVLVTEATGEGVVLDTGGRVVREWESPHRAAVYAAGAGRIVAARSPYRVPQFAPEPDTAPLLLVLDTLGRPIERLGVVRVPGSAFLTQLVNAGAVAVDDSGAVYFAPLARDEIRKYGPSGDPRWTTKRGLYPVEADPEFLPARGREIGVHQALAGVALAVGPRGRLYALGAADSSATRLRVDVLYAASGRILETRLLDSTESAVAVDRHGRLVTFDASLLLAGAGAEPRLPLEPGFALPDLRGDTVRLTDYRGRVTLVNFWASWCDPCREEFPHMAELYRELGAGSGAFAIAAISDDVDRRAMLGFVREFQPPFPILVGGGRMKARYRYRGLPYSVLLDRNGRVVERIFGFGGAAEFRRLRETIAKEVAAP